MLKIVIHVSFRIMHQIDASTVLCKNSVLLHVTMEAMIDRPERFCKLRRSVLNTEQRGE